MIYNNKSLSNGRKTAFGAAAAALICILLLLAQVLVFNTLTIFVIISLVIAVVIVEVDLRTAFITYIASTLIALLFVLDKTLTLNYCVFFGLYAIVKFLIEQIRVSRSLQMLIKVVCLNGLMLLLAAAYQFLLGIDPASMLSTDKLIKVFGQTNPTAMLLLTGVLIECGFIVYDVVLTIAVSTYMDRLSQRWKNGR